MNTKMPGQLALQMKREFDEQFSAPRLLAPETTEEFLIIRVGRARFALRVRELGGMFRCPQFTPFPSSHRAVVGLAGVQGSVIVVYDTGTLLGAAPAQTDGGWILLRRTDRSSALLFDAPEGYRVVPESAIVSSTEGPAEQPTPRQVFFDDGGSISIVEEKRLDSAIFGTMPR